MTERLTTSDRDLERAALLLKEGKLVAFPTETVYGLGAILDSRTAIEELYKIKKRPFRKPFSAHIHSLEQARLLSDALPDLFYFLADRFLPGPLTMIVKRNDRVPAIVVGGASTIGIRMPSHQVAMRLLQYVGVPVVATSVNLASEPPALCAEEVLSTFDGLIAAVVDGGPSPIQLSSTVVSIDDEGSLHIIREGAIAKETLLQLLN